MIESHGSEQSGPNEGDDPETVRQLQQSLEAMGRLHKENAERLNALSEERYAAFNEKAHGLLDFLSARQRKYSRRLLIMMIPSLEKAAS